MSDERTAFELRADCLRLMDEAEQLFTVDEPNDDIHRNNQIRGNQLMGQAQILASLAATTMGYELFRAENENQDVAAPSVGKLPDTETLLAETPDVEVERYMRESFEGVGELEWQENETANDKAWRTEFNAGRWMTRCSRDLPGVRLWLRGEGYPLVGAHSIAMVKDCADDVEARALANSLQRILSGAAEEATSEQVP